MAKSKEAVILKKKTESFETEIQPQAKAVYLNAEVPVRITEDEILEKITKSQIHIKNAKYLGAHEAFPHEPALRTVDRFYPNADGGPLYLDEPQHEDDVKICKRKAEIIKKYGGRYAFITKETTLHDVAQQLGL